jgi:hypothetical protein
VLPSECIVYPQGKTTPSTSPRRSYSALLVRLSSDHTRRVEVKQLDDSIVGVHRRSDWVRINTSIVVSRSEPIEVSQKPSISGCVGGAIVIQSRVTAHVNPE